MLDPHQFLVAIFSILLVKLVDGALLNSYLIDALARYHLRCIDLDVNFRPQRPETLIELLLAAQGAMRIEYIKGLHVQLVPASDDFGEEVCFGELWPDCRLR